MGIKSALGKNNLEFNHVKIDILHRNEMWSSLFEFCHSALTAVLTIPSTPKSSSSSYAWADDRLVWDMLAKSAKQLQVNFCSNAIKITNVSMLCRDLETRDKALILVQDFLRRDPSSRNANKAKYLLQQDSREFVTSILTSSNFFDDFKASREGLALETQDLEDSCKKAYENAEQMLSKNTGVSSQFHCLAFTLTQRSSERGNHNC